jgi:hypothetical protein
MKPSGLIFCLACLVSLPVVQEANAIDIEDLDEGDKRKKAKKAKKAKIRAAKIEADEVVREIERGYFVKASGGMSMYLLNYGRTLKAGTAVSLAFGGDFLDRENMSMAWEISVGQGVHNGEPFRNQTGEVPYIQGDTRTYIFTANYEVSAYPSRRFGIGARIGAGVVLTPLLMDKTWYESEVLGEWGIPSPGPAVHRQPHPVVTFGPTLEYYTKLSHFSIGLDVDASYAIGFDLGLSAAAYMKYTFGKRLGSRK